MIISKLFNYIKNLVYAFELINLNLSGNNLCRNIRIEIFNKEIERIYNTYSLKIVKKNKLYKYIHLIK